MLDRPTLVFYRALLVLQLCWALVTAYLLWGRQALPVLGGRNDFWLAIIVIVLGCGSAYVMDQTRLRQAHRWNYQGRGATLHYRHSVFIRSALVQAANVSVLMMALLARRWETLLLVLPGLMFYWYLRPSLDELSKRYND